MEYVIMNFDKIFYTSEYYRGWFSKFLQYTI